jgi:hypothetical protein
MISLLHHVLAEHGYDVVVSILHKPQDVDGLFVVKHQQALVPRVAQLFIPPGAHLRHDLAIFVRELLSF